MITKSNRIKKGAKSDRLKKIEAIYGPDFGLKTKEEIRQAFAGKEYDALRGLILNE